MNTTTAAVRVVAIVAMVIAVALKTDAATLAIFAGGTSAIAVGHAWEWRKRNSRAERRKEK